MLKAKITALQTAIRTTKAAHPEWFTAADNKSNAPPASGDVKQSPPSQVDAKRLCRFCKSLLPAIPVSAKPIAPVGGPAIPGGLAPDAGHDEPVDPTVCASEECRAKAASEKK